MSPPGEGPGLGARVWSGGAPWTSLRGLGGARAGVRGAQPRPTSHPRPPSVCQPPPYGDQGHGVSPLRRTQHGQRAGRGPAPGACVLRGRVAAPASRIHLPLLGPRLARSREPAPPAPSSCLSVCPPVHQTTSTAQRLRSGEQGPDSAGEAAAAGMTRWPG